jgi:hypothetical protein
MDEGLDGFHKLVTPDFFAATVQDVWTGVLIEEDEEQYENDVEMSEAGEMQEEEDTGNGVTY